MFDLQAVSPVAPSGDILFGLVLIGVSVLAAHLLLVPGLARADRRSAWVLLGVSLFGAGGVVGTLLLRPPQVYTAALLYIAAFAVLAGTLARSRIGRVPAAMRVGVGVAIMLLALGAASWIANMPR